MYPNGRKFSTAHTRGASGNYAHRLFSTHNVDTATACHHLCLEHGEDCLGVFYETVSHRCHGLDDLGRSGGSSTRSESQSWTVVREHTEVAPTESPGRLCQPQFQMCATNSACTRYLQVVRQCLNDVDFCSQMFVLGLTNEIFVEFARCAAQEIGAVYVDDDGLHTMTTEQPSVSSVSER